MNKTLILVVEDDRPIRNLIVTTLKTHDYKYLTAENGEKPFWKHLHTIRISFSGSGLPDMEGVEVIKKIRTWSNMPIIVISARSEDSDKLRHWTQVQMIILQNHFQLKNCLHVYVLHKDGLRLRRQENSRKHLFLKMVN